MLQLSPQQRIFVCVAGVDFSKGIDGWGGYCRRHLQQDPLSGALFVFRNRRRTAIKLLVYDGHRVLVRHEASVKRAIALVAPIDA